MRKWIFVALVAALVVGCKSTETQAPAPIDDKAPVAVCARRPGAATSGTANLRRQRHARRAMSPLKDPNNILSKRTVYFDYDSFVVKDEYRAMVDAHAKYLQANRARARHAAGPCRRARQPRIQHRARPEARRRREEADAAPRRHGNADRDGELRQGKAQGRRSRRDRVGAEPPRRNHLRRRVTLRSSGVRAIAAALAARRGLSRRPRVRRCSTMTRRASASRRPTSG